jgi:hypothetical protein
MAYSRYSKKSRRAGYGYGRRNKGNWSKLLMILAIVLIPLITIVGGGFAAYAYLGKEKIDAAYCYARPDQHQAAAFIDYSLTHQTSDSQQRDLVNTLMQTFRNMPPNGRLSVFTTANSATATVNVPVFTLCNPAQTAREQDLIGAPSKSTTMIAREHKEAGEAFQQFVETLIAQSQDASQLATSSPILEQIQGISRYDFGAPLSELLLYTDGINNSPNGQFCAKQGHLPRFEVFAKRPEYRFIAPRDFGGATIDYLMVEGGALPSTNLPFCTNAELRGFWVDYFEGNGAGSVTLTPLGYGAGQ